MKEKSTNSLASYVEYPDKQHMLEVCSSIAKLPNLLTKQSVDLLRSELVAAEMGGAFLLHAGDCTERFDVPTPVEQLLLIEQLKQQLQKDLGKPVVCVLRGAGQTAKPRTKKRVVTSQGQEIYNYHGDMINAPDENEVKRRPDPGRLYQAYHYAAQCMANIPSSLFVSREMLQLNYEQALLHEVSGKTYHLATHLPWVGWRTNEVEGVHCKLAASLENPVAIKIGPDTQASQITAWAKKLNPQNKPGKLVFIYRLGCTKTASVLPQLLREAKINNIACLWCCDPMHGNTEKIGDKKTRRFDLIQQELLEAVAVHKKEGVPMHGVHLEVSVDAVGECEETQTKTTKTTEYCVDPRLSPEQAKRLLRGWPK